MAIKNKDDIQKNELTNFMFWCDIPSRYRAAKVLGVSKTSITNWVEGKRIPVCILKLIKYAAAYYKQHGKFME